MRENLYVLLLLLAALSCSDKETLDDKLVTNLDEFKSYSLDINQPKIKFWNLIESVEIMKLEETNNSLLPRLLKLQTTDDHLVLTSASQAGMLANQGDIFVFDLTGNIVNRINRKGCGPEEYIEINDMWLDGNTLSVYSRLGAKVNRYNLDGDFIDSRKSPYQAGHILGYENGYALDMNYELIDDSLRWRFAVLDKDLEVRATYLPYKTTPNIKFFFASQTLTRYKNGVLFLRQVSDTVYFLKDNALSPIVHLDFGQEWFWNEKIDISRQYLQEIQRDDGIWNIDMHMGEKYIYAIGVQGFSSDGDTPYFLVDRLTNEVHNINFRTQGDTKFSVRAEGWDGERMIYSMSSDKIAPFLSELSENQIKFRQGTTIEEIESSENPVLMWVKFKK
jgi:hypothetical protein